MKTKSIYRISAWRDNDTKEVIGDFTTYKYAKACFDKLNICDEMPQIELDRIDYLDGVEDCRYELETKS